MVNFGYQLKLIFARRAVPAFATHSPLLQAARTAVVREKERKIKIQIPAGIRRSAQISEPHMRLRRVALRGIRFSAGSTPALWLSLRRASRRDTYLGRKITTLQNQVQSLEDIVPRLCLSVQMASPVARKQARSTNPAPKYPKKLSPHLPCSRSQMSD